jgi:hypothetical protein
MNGTNTYKERQSVANVAEFLFEYYCAEKEYQLVRCGFDEKNKNIDNFFRLNPLLRNLPDYIVNTNNDTFVVNVKGTANIKQKEIDLLPKFIENYGSKEAQLMYAFCFIGNDPKLIKPEKVSPKINKFSTRDYRDYVAVMAEVTHAHEGKLCGKQKYQVASCADLKHAQLVCDSLNYMLSHKPEILKSYQT